MEILEVLRKRKSVRSFTGEKPTEEQLAAIIKAANAAPVGMGKYENIHLTVIEDPELLAKIEARAGEFFGKPDFHPLYGAPVLIVVSARGEGNVPSANVGIVIHSMALEAVDLGLGHVDIYGATAALAGSDELVAELDLPDEDFVPTGSIALGVTDETYEIREIPERISINRI